MWRDMNTWLCFKSIAWKNSIVQETKHPSVFKAAMVERLLLFLSTKPQHVVDKRSETDLFDNSLFDNSVKQQLQLALN